MSAQARRAPSSGPVEERLDVFLPVPPVAALPDLEGSEGSAAAPPPHRSQMYSKVLGYFGARHERLVASIRLYNFVDHAHPFQPRRRHYSKPSPKHCMNIPWLLYRLSTWSYRPFSLADCCKTLSTIPLGPFPARKGEKSYLRETLRLPAIPTCRDLHTPWFIILLGFWPGTGETRSADLEICEPAPQEARTGPRTGNTAYGANRVLAASVSRTSDRAQHPPP